MSELSPRSRSLLSRASEFGEPTAADSARVRRAVIATVSVAATSAAGGTALGVLKAALVFAVSASIGSGVVYVGKQAIAPPRPPSPAPIVVVVQPAPAPVSPPAPLEVEPAPAEPAPSPPAPAAKPVAKSTPRAALPSTPEPAVAPPPAAPPPPAPAPAPACDLGRELAAVERAQQLLDAAPAQALEAVDALERSCPDGTLQPERMTVRALALCALDRRDEGQRARRWLEEHAPDSPGMARVRLACP